MIALLHIRVFQTETVRVILERINFRLLLLRKLIIFKLLSLFFENINLHFFFVKKTFPSIFLTFF